MWAMLVNSSVVRCEAEPVPALPWVILRCLASAITSLSVPTGRSFFTTSTIGVVAISMTGSKSLLGL